MPPRHIGFLVPGSLDARSGGSLYDRRMVDGLRARDWRVEVRELDESFPFPSAAALDDARRALAAFADGTLVVVDSLALGALPDALERERARLRIVGLVHLPLASDVARAPDVAARLFRDERRAFAAAARHIVTGAATLELLAPYGVAEHDIDVVEPGTDRAPLARGSGSHTPLLLSVATLNAGKGHETLLHALARLRSARWRLRCVGSTTRDPATTARVRAAAAELGLADRVAFAGELDAAGVARAYDEADVFVTATLRETYGMAVAEALARGLPVIGTRTGAIPALAGDQAGIVVEPGDASALADALARVLGDAALRARLAAGARAARERLPTWEDAVGKMAAALSRVAHA